MVEILKSFEQVASRFSTVVLILPGLAMLALGLVAWLGGMHVRRIVLGLVGALVGGIAGFIASGQNPAAGGLAAVGVGALGIFVPRLFAAVVLAFLAAAVTFTVLARGPLAQTPGTLFARGALDRIEKRLTVRESLDATQAYALDIADRVKAVSRTLAPSDSAMIAAIGAALLAVGLLFARPSGALACSMIGTGLVFAGMGLLLTFKGSAPIARMQQQGALYGTVALGMIAFGALEQVLLCRAPERREAQRGGRSRQRQSKQSWRNR
jgi:hypothetical protein